MCETRGGEGEKCRVGKSERKEVEGVESILSFAPQATACHHICIKPVRSSRSTCWLSEQPLRRREKVTVGEKEKTGGGGNKMGRDPEV